MVKYLIKVQRVPGTMFEIVEEFCAAPQAAQDGLNGAILRAMELAESAEYAAVGVQRDDRIAFEYLTCKGHGPTCAMRNKHRRRRADKPTLGV